MRNYWFVVLAFVSILSFSPFSVNAANLEDDELFEIESLSFQEEGDPITLELIAEANALKPGQGAWLALKISHQGEWHTYWKNSGQTGMPLNVEWQLPEGYAIRELLWPCPKRLNHNGIIGYGYEGEIALLAYLDVPAQKPITNAPVHIGALVKWVACSDALCLPGDNEVEIKLPLSDASVSADPLNTTFFAKAYAEIPKKNWEFELFQAGRTLELHMQNQEKISGTIADALFFPETPNTIDDLCKVHIQSSINQDGRYTLRLSCKQETPLSRLKGILVLQPPLNSMFSAQAIDLDLPVFVKEPDPNLPNDFIAFVENASETLPSSPFTAATPNAEAPFEGGLLMALFFAFIGGFILNFMPCVLPVISLKILSFVKLAGEKRSAIFKQGALFALGIISSFWLLAALMLIMQSYGQNVGWGFQLKEPLFVGALTLVIFAFALNMFGVFEFATSMTAIAGQAQHNQAKKGSSLGSFFSGVLTTAVATPCIGPFLGPAIGFAVTLPAYDVLLLFTVLGLGMACPYLVFGAFPACLRFLPKPGPWMITFKETVGFLMMATALWLVWVFSALTGSMAVSVLLLALFLMALAAWTYGRNCLPHKTKLKKTLGLIASIVFALSSIWALHASTSPLFAEVSHIQTQIASKEAYDWEPYSKERLEELKAKKVPVFIDFTAKWCLICQVNHFVLSTDNILKKMQTSNVVKMKADWTRQDEHITDMLRQFGRNGVPLYLLYGEDGKPQVLPQVLTPDIIADAIDAM